MLNTKQQRRRKLEVAVQVIDCDVHPYPSPLNSHLVAEHTPEPWRTRFFGRGHAFKHGDTILFDTPDFAHAHAMRVDTSPPGGGFPCSDPDFAFEQLIRGAAVDLAILQPLVRHEIDPEAEQARRNGINGWLAETWLGEHNVHRRWRGSICVTLNDPAGAAREIERWAGHPDFVQALVVPELAFGFGHPRCDPVYAAASRHGLPIAVHLNRGPNERLPMSPVGFQSYWHDFMTPWPLLFAAHIASLIFDGVFERFPELHFVFVEGGFTWALPLMWRMDAYWEARRHDVPWVKRRPSEYVREHIRFTSQPLEDPEDSRDLVGFLESSRADELVMFSTDYPHWSYDDPSWAVKRIPKPQRDRILHRNAHELYRLPDMVPALD